MLLTYEDDANVAGNDGNDSGGTTDGVGDGASKRPRRVHRPRSMLFRAVVEFNPFAKSSGKGLPTSKNDGANRRWAKVPSLRRKRKGGVDDDRVADGAAEVDAYDPPTIV